MINKFKSLVFLVLLMTVVNTAKAQSKSISFASKSKDPYISFAKDTLLVDSDIVIGLGTVPDGSFKFIQMLNAFNEPISAADSKASMKVQKIKFFKTQDGTTYAFTKYFVINIEAALLSKEIIIKK